MTETAKSPDVVCAGHLCLDIAPGFAGPAVESMSRVFRPGSLHEVGPAELSTGGSVSNTGQGLVRLGLGTAFMALVGEDSFGETVRKLMGRSGETSGIRSTPRAATSYSVVVSPPGVDRMFLHHPGANSIFGSGDIDYELTVRARAFHLGYPPVMRNLYSDSGRELIRILRRVRGQGVLTSLDLCMADPDGEGAQAGWPSIFRNLLPLVDIFAPSVEEALLFMEPGYYRSLLGAGDGDVLERIPVSAITRLGEEFIRLGCGICMLKAGSHGLYIRTSGSRRLEAAARSSGIRTADWAGREFWQSPFRPASTVSATGAGDACIAGLLAAFLRGLPPETAAGSAGLAGSLSLSATDSFSGLHSLDRMLEMLSSTEPETVGPPRKLGPDWKPCSDAGLYERRR